MRYSFRNDYSEGAHPALMNALACLSGEQNEGYGMDRHSLNAARLLRERFGCADAHVHFFEGGTQANLTALCAFLRPHEAVVSAQTGHIAVHEAGAVEATGHKVCTVPCQDGRLTPQAVLSVLDEHCDEHMVKPRLVYLSNATELGTAYSRADIQALHRCCRENGLLLYLDGARLGNALCAENNDLSPRDIAAFTDAFYVGGTKNGALMGEALLIVNPGLQEDFRYIYKQRGAMPAKCAVIGAQFEALFSDALYFDLAGHANAMAAILRDGLAAMGVSFLSDSPTNQIFPILSSSCVERLSGMYGFEIYRRLEGQNVAIRLVASWATPESAVRRFLDDIAAIAVQFSL